MPNTIARDRVLELLRLDHETGQFYWKKNKARAIAGEMAGTVRNNGYRSLQIDGIRFLCHRLVWLVVHGEFPKYVIDHIDGDRLNNRPENLRDVPERLNFHNNLHKMRPNNTSGFKGVTWSKAHGKYHAQMMVNRKHIFLGSFASAKDAHECYLSAKNSVNLEASP